MKQCPQCRKVYLDDNLNFCLDDGTTLIQSADETEAETVQLPRRQTAQGSASSPPVIRRGVNPLFAYLAIGLISLMIGGALVAWVMSKRYATPDRTSETNVRAKMDNTSANDMANNSNSNVERNNTNIPTPPTPPATTEPVDVPATKEEVENALNAWLRALTSKDLDTRMSFYANRLSTYYTKKNVALSAVRTENATVFGRYSDLDMDISNLDMDVDETTGEVTATFDKTFNFHYEERNFEGSVRSEFRWKKIGGRWRIISERDLKVY